MTRPLMTVAALAVFASTACSQGNEARDSSGLWTELDRVLEEAAQEAEDSPIADALGRLAENPLDLNNASAEELEHVPGVTPIMAARIVGYREGILFQSIDELLLVDGFRPEFLERVRPFFGVRSAHQVAPRLQVSVRSRTSRDLEDARGFRNGDYLGSPLKLYNRLTARYGVLDQMTGVRNTGIELGLLAEKDPGEARFNDFTSGYLALTVPRASTRIILGDYNVEAAEGLSLWSPVGFLKGAEVISVVRKNGKGIVPYASSDENSFFRGIAVQWNSAPLRVSAFYSSRPISVSLTKEGSIASIRTSGLHRTPQELREFNNSHETILGIRSTVTIERGFDVGMTAFAARFGNPLDGRDLTGNSDTGSSLDASFSGDRFNIFSEVAPTGGGKLAEIAGIVYEPHRHMSVAILHRSYPADFVSPHAFGFRESSGPTQNESGFYVGMQLRPHPIMSLSFYLDQSQSSWRTPSIPLPSEGNDILAAADILPSTNLKFFLQFKRNNKPSMEDGVDSSGRATSFVSERQQSNYRATLEFRPSSKFQWTSRFEVVAVRRPVGAGRGEGYLVFHDAYMTVRNDFTLECRVIIFDTGSFDSRLYEFEPEVKGTYSNPALFGRGVRWYVRCQKTLLPDVELSVKYSRTIKDGAKSIGSGEGEIIGDIDSRITVQMDCSF